MGDNIAIRLALPEDDQRVLDFLRIHFYPEEPVNLGEDPPQQDADDEAFLISNIAVGTCLVATKPCDDGNEADADGEGKVVVGVALAGPKDAHEAEHLAKQAARLGPTKFGRVVELLARVERDADVCARFGVDSALHVHALVVDGRLRGRRLGERLLRDLMERGRERGYPVLTVDCTSVYSAQILRRVGAECINTLRYDEYLDERGQPVFRPPPPHDCISTFAIRLS